jgi:hypothetical protein
MEAENKRLIRQNNFSLKHFKIMATKTFISLIPGVVIWISDVCQVFVDEVTGFIQGVGLQDDHVVAVLVSTL